VVFILDKIEKLCLEVVIIVIIIKYI